MKRGSGWPQGGQDWGPVQQPQDRNPGGLEAFPLCLPSPAPHGAPRALQQLWHKGERFAKNPKN